MASKRGNNGVTLYELHGEDIELHESNTKAKWKENLNPDLRRVVLSNRPIRPDETVHVKLSGTGCVRLGLTNFSPYAEEDLQNFDGDILFTDFIYERTVVKQIELNFSHGDYEATYKDMLEAEKESTRRSTVPTDFEVDTLFLFGEIIFGSIRLSFQSSLGASLTNISMRADQIVFDETGHATLSHTTGCVVIPEIELKIDTPVFIILKPTGRLSGTNRFLRFGLTNIPPRETTEDTLLSYALANSTRGKTAQCSAEDIPYWFRDEALRAESFTSDSCFTLCLTKEFELRTNINPIREDECLVVIGPDLKQPTWLVLETFQAEVIVEAQHKVNQEAIVKDEELSSSKFIVAAWEDKEITDEAIIAFVSLKIGDKPDIRRGNQRNIILMIFKKEKKIDFLRLKLQDASFWSLELLLGVMETCSVLVCGLPHGEMIINIGLFFNNNHRVKMDLTVLQFDYKPMRGEAVLVLSSPEDVHRLCAKKLEYKKHSLKLCPYYDILYGHEGKLVHDEQSFSQNNCDIDFGDVKKVKYVQEYQELKVGDKMAKECTKIKWRNEQGSKVRFEHCCQCNQSEICQRNWIQQSERVFKRFLNQVHIEKRIVQGSVWTQVTEVIYALRTNEIKVSKDDRKLEIEIIGTEDDKDLRDLMAAIDCITRPPASISEKIELVDAEKLQAMVKFHIISKIEKEENVSAAIEQTGVILKGPQQNVKIAKDRIYAEYIQIQKHVRNLPNKHYKELLQTGMVQDKIAFELAKFKLNEGIDWKVVASERLYVICKSPDLLKQIADTIVNVIRNQEFQFEGDASKHGDKLDAEISKIRETYKPYARISNKTYKGNIVVSITCIEGYMDTLHQKVKEAVEPYLTREIKISLPVSFALYINDYMSNELQMNLKREEINGKALQYKNDSFFVIGQARTCNNIKHAVNSLAKQVHMEWVAHTAHGIDMYFSEKEGVELIRSMRGQCVLKLMTKNEMKNNNVHAVTVLDSGAVLFALAGDITDPVEDIDVVVNTTDPGLEHRYGISRAIAKIGGDDLRMECSNYLGKHGALGVGDVIMSSPGKLPYQKVFHVTLQGQDINRSNDDGVIRKTIRNIFRKIDGSDEHIFRSVAMPLLGAVTRHNSKLCAKATVETLKQCLEQHRIIRQVFLYDRNPEVVRAIHSEMQRVFSNACFSPPVENVDINKAKTMKPFGVLSLRRTGVRTIPLPGDKRLLITWGELKFQQVDVIVNITTTDSTLSGKISKSLIDASRRPGFDLDKEYEKEVKKGNYGDGDIIQTTSGRLPCGAIYHLKIETQWQESTGRPALRKYIETCLLSAIKRESKSIAFPTIGTADCGYPKDEVAQVFLRTIGEFMTKRSSSKLEEISVVIYKDDQESTMAFENEISEIYSERPHRLEAIIEDSLVLNKKGEAIEEREKKQDDDAHAAKPQPQSYQTNKGEKSTYKITDTISLQLNVENIEKIVADVIVCTTSAGSFPSLFGAIANAIKQTGGTAIQAECKRKYPHGIPKNDIASTAAGSLPCKKIFYIPLQEYKSPSDTANIKEFVKRCLKQADSSGFTTICFPSIGTGNFKYSDNDSATEMYDALKEYFTAPAKNLKMIIIALFAGATNTVKVFQQVASKTFQPIQLQKGGQAQAFQSNSKPVQQKDGTFVVAIPNTSASIEIAEGQLELSSVDVILNTTTSFPNLNGAVPDAICRRGGQAIKDECKQYVGSADDGDIIETKAGNLSCKRLYHYVLPSWDTSSGVQMIQKCIHKCLSLMANSGFQSIAVPAIGTGGYKYEPSKVAEGIYTALKEYAASCPSKTIRVKIVLYAPSKFVNSEIFSFFQNIPATGAGSKAVVEKKRVSFGDASEKEPAPKIDPKQDFVLLKMISRDKDKISQVKQKIAERIKADSSPLYIDFPKHGEDILKKEKNKKILKELGASYKVEINVDFSQKQIYFNGISPKKTECREQVRNLLSEMADKQGNLIVGRHLLQSVEWCYLEGDGKILVPYPKSIAFTLQTEDSRGANEVKFKDTDGQEYEVDLQKLEESRLENGLKTSVVGVLKKDLASGELGNFPDTWDPMDKNDDVLEVPLDTTKQEFADVLNAFMSTIGNAQMQQVIEIRRIQNKSLYLLYKAEKERLDRISVQKSNEMALWHGTSVNKEKYIISDGFNRSYAGNTFGGQVWYGSGVYFAVCSEYSAGDAYSPRDYNGVKRVFQVDVLVGDCTVVPKGFSAKVPPLKPGSSTERYDSTCDDIVNPDEFVIYRDTSAYPAYIILFQ